MNLGELGLRVWSTVGHGWVPCIVGSEKDGTLSGRVGMAQRAGQGVHCVYGGLFASQAQLAHPQPC